MATVLRGNQLVEVPDSQFEIDPAKALETAAANVRAKRDSLLHEHDWMVTREAETGVLMPPDVKAYRAALRDITSHANFPYLDAADWPVKPE